MDKGHRNDEKNVLYVEKNHKRRLALECIEIAKFSYLQSFNPLNRINPIYFIIKKIYSKSPFYSETEF